MTRRVFAAVFSAIIRFGAAGCSTPVNSVEAPHVTHAQAYIQQPLPDNPNPPPPGSSHINTQCSASDPTCAGPWSATTASYDNWATESAAGNGVFKQVIICADPASCVAAGYSGAAVAIQYSWTPNFGTSGSMFFGYQPACDSDFNDAYPSGCTPTTLVYQGKNAQAGQACLGSPLTIGFAPSGVDNTANDIKQIYAIRGQRLASHTAIVAAYVYQTGAGAYLFQLNATASAGVGAFGASTATPAFLIGGINPSQLTSAMNAALGLMSITSPPDQISRLMNSGLGFAAFPCFMVPWNGTYS